MLESENCSWHSFSKVETVKMLAATARCGVPNAVTKIIVVVNKRDVYFTISCIHVWKWDLVGQPQFSLLSKM